MAKDHPFEGRPVSVAQRGTASAFNPRVPLVFGTVARKPRPVGDAPPEPEPLELRLEELEFDQCRWPVNAPERGGRFLFCGADVDLADPPSVGRHWCAYHRWRGLDGRDGAS